jgi:hypothetical protein
MGLLIDLLAYLGHGEASALRIVFGLLLATQAMALAWSLLRRPKPASA